MYKCAFKAVRFKAVRVIEVTRGSRAATRTRKENAAHMELLIDQIRLKYGRYISIRTLETLINPPLTSAVNST
jgi:hypothetical protein